MYQKASINCEQINRRICEYTAVSRVIYYTCKALGSFLISQTLLIERMYVTKVSFLQTLVDYFFFSFSLPGYIKFVYNSCIISTIQKTYASYEKSPKMHSLHRLNTSIWKKKVIFFYWITIDSNPQAIPRDWLPRPTLKWRGTSFLYNVSRYPTNFNLYWSIESGWWDQKKPSSPWTGSLVL